MSIYESDPTSDAAKRFFDMQMAAQSQKPGAKIEETRQAAEPELMENVGDRMLRAEFGQDADTVLHAGEIALGGATEEE